MAHTPVGHRDSTYIGPHPMDTDCVMCSGSVVAPPVPSVDNLHRREISRLHRHRPAGYNQAAVVIIHIWHSKLDLLLTGYIKRQ